MCKQQQHRHDRHHHDQHQRLHYYPSFLALFCFRNSSDRTVAARQLRIFEVASGGEPPRTAEDRLVRSCAVWMCRASYQSMLVIFHTSRNTNISGRISKYLDAVSSPNTTISPNTAILALYVLSLFFSPTASGRPKVENSVFPLFFVFFVCLYYSLLIDRSR